MHRFLTMVRQALHWIGTPLRLVREGEADLAGTYPERPGPTGQQAMLQGVVTTSLMTSGMSAL